MEIYQFYGESKRFWTPIEPETFECIAESGRGDEDHLQGRPWNEISQLILVFETIPNFPKNTPT